MVKRTYIGYLARNDDGSLWFHKAKPHKRGTIWVNPKGQNYMDRDYFPEVRKDLEEPICVKITIDIPYTKEYK